MTLDREHIRNLAERQLDQPAKMQLKVGAQPPIAHTLAGYCLALLDELETLKRDAIGLSRWTRHHSTCDQHNLAGACDCGLNAAWQEIQHGPILDNPRNLR